MSRSKQTACVLTAELLCKKRENLTGKRQYRLFFCPRAENERRKELIKGEGCRIHHGSPIEKPE